MLTKRKENILKLIVEEYIRLARPVGSTTICETLGVSSATVRNEMAELEELEMIEKAHTSSGRMPSEKGYQYYVDNLMEPKKMTGEDMLKLQTIFSNNQLSLTDAVLKSLEIISEMTNYTAVVLGNKSEDSKLQQIEVVPVDSTSLIAIIVTDKGHVEHKRISNLGNISLDEIRKMVELINKLVAGTPINEVSTKLEFDIKPIIGQYVAQHEMVYNAFYNVFSDFQVKHDVHMKGKSSLLKQPEFDNSSKIRDLVNKFEDELVIDSIEENSEDINIYIGSKSNFDEDVTVIKTKYFAGNSEGTIAVIGPKRMEYDRVVGILEYIKESLEEVKK